MDGRPFFQNPSVFRPYFLFCPFLKYGRKKCCHSENGSEISKAGKTTAIKVKKSLKRRIVAGKIDHCVLNVENPVLENNDLIEEVALSTETNRSIIRELSDSMTVPNVSEIIDIR